ncbi:glutaredoxin 3 [uncultured Thiothrix sp.]|uniref:glutaredoxin 3 n=1 Tax=uncultured Thiothrix sp. TaxID=223185 RepID=UPI002604D933|nr:glutaredoxin 3 [uncultured Thiothrix sp.]
MPTIKLYGTRFCPYCVRARLLLKQKQVEFEDLPVGGAGISWAELEAMTKRDTVPQIYIGDLHVGGYDDLAALNRSGELDKLLGLV